MSFSRQPCPVWLFDDLVGNTPDDNYYISFLENTIPYLPKPVYQDDQGTIPWANPLEFHPDGTLPDNLYFEDGAVYRLEIRRGPTQNDPLIRLIENFVAGNGQDPTDVAVPIDNQITNPQFAFIEFADPYVIENTGTNSYYIAPGWVLELVSGGAVTVTLSRVAITGDDNIPDGTPTNPSYALSIEVTSGTLTSSKLIQRFDHAPAIWASEGISINFTGKMLNNNAEITVNYVPSDGTATTVVSDTLSTVYQFITGGVQLPASDSTDTGDDGYVDIVFILPISGTCFLTNIQAIGSPQAAAYPYAQTTVERQRDQTFHHYADAVIHQPKTNLVVGWDFALNPYQFNTKTLNLVSPGTAYTTDQTIVHTTNDVSLNVGQAAASEGYGYKIKAVNTKTENRFCLIQYIDPASIRSAWSQILSSMAKARIFTTHGTQVKVKMRLIYRVDLPPILSATEPVASWAADSDPVFAAGWTEIVPNNDPEYLLPNAYDTDVSPGAYPSFPFEKFAMPAASTEAMTLGVVFYTMDNMNDTLGTEDYIVVKSISLVENDFAIDASPISFDETLRQCQFYYEKSYDIGVAAGTVTNIGQKQYPTFVHTTGGTTNLYIQSFVCDFMQVKRAIPSAITFFSPTSATSNRASLQINQSAAALVQGNVIASNAWQLNPAVTSTERFQMLSLNTTTIELTTGGGALGDEGIINYHYLADARLGVS